MSKKILVYGGSFDPPHRGHLLLLKAAFKAVRPDFCHVAPAFVSPFKSGPAESFASRKKLIGLALEEAFSPAERKKITVDPFECRQKRKTYTYELLRHLRRRYPGAVFYLLMGSDCALSFGKWRNYREVAARAQLLVGVRSDAPDITPARETCAFWILDGAFPPVSSTAVRARIYSSGKVPHDVPDVVAGYIKKRGLYGLRAHKYLKTRLKPERYEHSLGVAKLARELAERHGGDPADAALAGLLHDAGKQYSRGRLRAFAARHGLLRKPWLREIAQNQPSLLHSFAGAVIARKEFSVSDDTILLAVESHTLGRAGMTLLEKIIFVADASSEERGFRAAREIRAAAFKNLDAAVCKTAAMKLSHIIKGAKWFCPKGLELWNSLIRRTREKDSAE